MRRLVISTAVAVVALSAVGEAVADTRVEAEIARKNTRAMETYDLLEYEEARRLLTEAIAIAKRNDLKTEVVALAYLNLAIVYYSGFQEEAIARMAMIDAVEIDETVEIDRAYRTPELAGLLEATKKEFGTSTRPEDDCGRVKGVKHVQIDEAKAGTAQLVESAVGKEVRAAEVILSYRHTESRRFSKVTMRKVGECGYVGVIPGDAIAEPAVHYFIGALNRDGRVVAARGAIQAPIVMDVVENPNLANGNEDPLAGAEVKKRIFPTAFLLGSAGTGGGVVTGTTEQADSQVGCCFAPSLFNAVAEVGYLVKKELAIGIAFRYGIPLTANIPGHATGAIAVVGRLRYGVSGTLDGLQVIGSLGGGLMRHTVRLSDAMEGMDIDTSASGPFILGPGVGYWFHVGGPLRIFAELHALAGIPAGIDTIGTCPGEKCVDLNFSLQFDANVGLAAAF